MPRVDALVDLGVVSAEIDARVGSAVRDVMAEVGDSWAATGHPVWREVATSITVNATQATANLAFAVVGTGPQSGRLWSIRSMVVWAAGSGNNAFTSTGGVMGTAVSNVVAAAFITGQQSNPPPGDIVPANPSGAGATTTAPYSSVPGAFLWGAQQATVRGVNQLVLGLAGSGLLANAVYLAKFTLVEQDDDPRFLLDL